jgi:hypothetical protein
MGIIEYMGKYLFLFYKSSKKNVRQNTYDDISDMLARFVIDNYGKKIGESVAVYHDLLIIKQKKTYLGIPMKHVTFEGKKLLVKGLIDSSKAKKLGNDWKKSTYNEITYPEEDP